MYKYVKFSTTGCGQCMAMSQALKSLRVEYAEVMLDQVNNADEIMDQLAIRRVPTLIKFKEGCEVDRITGHTDLPTYRKFFGI